jgi:hypothetical protein
MDDLVSAYLFVIKSAKCTPRHLPKYVADSIHSNDMKIKLARFRCFVDNHMADKLGSTERNEVKSAITNHQLSSVELLTSYFQKKQDTSTNKDSQLMCKQVIDSLKEVGDTYAMCSLCNKSKWGA